ncbi:thioredoxin-like protein [Xylariales sp. AK1849]|nr:thioredoxin-like protein [Xylariales sp. AK1849]
MGQSKITLYVDVVSPFTYEAFHILQNEAAFKDVQITYVPIFLGGLMKACGNTAPIGIKNKDKWIQVERLRWAKAFSVPMGESGPPNFPPLTLNLMRALCALSRQDDGQEMLVRALARLYHELWVKHAEVAKEEVFGPILGEVLGKERARRVLAEASTSGKTALQQNTDKAFGEGAFGLPWIVATDSSGTTECFWGVDHIGQVLQFLRIEKPTRGGWKAVL